jgi:zinc protease
MVPKLYTLAILLFAATNSFGQLDKYKSSLVESNGYTYETVSNDPLNARIYTLANGLKVYMTVYKQDPRIQTYIAVKAGSKNDPAEATGLAHYLEHMLFKGTSRIGTSDWQEEAKELRKIEDLYEEYRQTVSTVKRKKIYHQIDSISQVASQYAIPNEYDKLLSNLGATGTNAYTFMEQTVYINNIPSNAIDKWAAVEAERFSMLAARLFHTELEAVYEEKNRALDNDGRKIWETMLAGVFPDHPYGTQTTIGTVEHLKNPSITEISKFFNKYYVPNNMAICLSGDFDPDQAIQIIDKQFSKLRPSNFEKFEAPPVNAPMGIKEDTIYGPEVESVNIGFRFSGRNKVAELHPQQEKQVVNEPDIYMLKIISLLLNNGQAGLIDLNLNQQQKVLSANAYEILMNDHSLFVLSGKPKAGQSLADVRDLLLAQIDSLKEGKFEEWLLEAVKNDYRTSQMKEYESNKARADAFVDAFISEVPWSIYIMESEILKSITKQDVIEFAKASFKNNYQLIYKLNGTDTSIVKVDKPSITPVKVNRDTQSQFYSHLMMQPTIEIQPEFVDFKKDLEIKETKQNIKVLYKKNTENELFSFYYLWDLGKNNNALYPLAAGYLRYLGISNLDNEALKQEFYKLGCNYTISVSDDAIVVSLTGLNENFDKAYKLLESVLANSKVDQVALDQYVDRLIKAREDSKKSKEVILRSALLSYATYGKDNPFSNNISNKDLKKLKGEDLVSLIKGLLKKEHSVLYYGPQELSAIDDKLKKYHKIPAKLTPLKYEQKFSFKNIDSNVVYFVDYDMVQAEVILLSKSINYNAEDVPVVSLYNEYFGGGMGSLVFQEMRESRALAYSVRSQYAMPGRLNEPSYNFSYIGTQSDKFKEAVVGMQDLLNNMPKSPELFKTAQTSVMENIRTGRVTKSAVLWNYVKVKKLGRDYDIRKNIFEEVGRMDYSEIEKFHQKYIQNQPMAILVIGSKDRIDMQMLEQFGKVKILSLEEIFGY